jgi:cytidylate kinase
MRKAAMAATTGKIIERQVHEWERQRFRAGEHFALPRHQKPIVTISSAYGSRGMEIGRLAAELLGYDVYDRRLVERIATIADERERTVRALDEKVQDWITEQVSGLFSSEAFTTSDYLRHLSSVVLALGKHGRAIIIGRGSQLILDPRATLRVRTTAPLAARAEVIAASSGQSIENAQATVLQKDAQRAAFYRRHFEQDPTDPDHYDLILNTSDDNLARHADLVAYAFLSKFGSPP